jgi:hypothetical protein
MGREGYGEEFTRVIGNIYDKIGRAAALRFIFSPIATILAEAKGYELVPGSLVARKSTAHRRAM